VEIARRIHAHAAAGVPFDRMAVLLRSPTQYRAHLEEAMRRAAVPVFFAQGTRRPDPAGRALLALLACAVEGLSARRFAEYLSLGEFPPPEGTEGAPPVPRPAADRWIAPDEDAIPAALFRIDEPAPFPDDAGVGDTDARPPSTPPGDHGLRVGPRRWERFLVDAIVIGGRDRWERRLEKLAKKLEVELAKLVLVEDPDGPRVLFQRSLIEDLAALRQYAIPLLCELEGLQSPTTWGGWIDRLGALATRALRRPDRVLAVLAELAPMDKVGPVTLREVRLALAPRLTELVEPPSKRRYGRVYVGPAEAARGFAFDVVFVPGLAEKIFPQKIAEDPILRDEARRKLGAALVTNTDRRHDERLALHLAVGAARKRVVVSYPRIDVEQARPRTPSFYGLEVVRAAEGVLPGFDELARRAEESCPARLGWPAPSRREDAIDEAEHDLALLTTLFPKRPEDTVGMARYLLDANPHLRRSLRARFARWHSAKWTKADGLVEPIPEAKAAIQKHALADRSYSPTALQNFAACPYRFLLYAVHRLQPREEPEPLEELDPLQKGSLVHETLFTLHVDLRERGLLPVTKTNQEEVRARLEVALATVAERFKDELAPAIDRVWEDGIAQIKADLLEWLRRAAEDPSYVPIRFELAFGLGPEGGERDKESVDHDLPLACGIRLRGSIDLVEQNAQTGALRATDYKTGKVRATAGAILDGGKLLQPVFYALALEKLFPGRTVEGGRLYYCTTAGDFKPVPVLLDDEARAAADLVGKTIGGAIDQGFLPAAPADGACEYCDYRTVCGPYEEQRAKKKKTEPLKPLAELRRHR
jgi:CRISPR/Cas system-associated exonuclease Cas4 (RecB family)